MISRDAQYTCLSSMFVLLQACAASVEPEGAAADSSRCVPLSVRGCPCYDGSVGRQVCDDSGRRYSACTSCDEGGAQSVPGYGDNLGAAKGVMCGVAFPVLCAAKSETCCVRSLSVDSCIPSSSGCACGTLECVATAVRCDGPEDCNKDEVCCGTPALDANDADGYKSFTCAKSCSQPLHQRMACHLGETSCPAGLVCSNSQYLTNMQVCVDPATLAQ
jgi:hypothetical protein